jgi:hypothetical protein
MGGDLDPQLSRLAGHLNMRPAIIAWRYGGMKAETLAAAVQVAEGEKDTDLAGKIEVIKRVRLSG